MSIDFAALRQMHTSAGATAVADALQAQLLAAGDLHSLFYAKLLSARVRLGVTPFPTGPSTELPDTAHEPYEDAIRSAARDVGAMYLEKGDLPRAWSLYRLIGEPGPVKAAIAALNIDSLEDTYSIVDLAWHQQLAPEKGFEIVLNRHGLCNAVSLVGSVDLARTPGLREYCVRGLIRVLHGQLLERVQGDLAGRGRSTDGDLFTLVQANPDLCTDDAYHVDTSHLSSVVQMSLHLGAGPGPELRLARDCAFYGERLASAFQPDGEAPFEAGYADYRAYLDTLLGENTEANLEQFRSKAQRELEEGTSYAASVYVNLLLALGRLPAAAAAATEYLADVAPDFLACPPPLELARQAGDFSKIQEIAEKQGDAVAFVAALVAAETARGKPLAVGS
ncbi:MAG: hypothetical protein ACRCZF_09130 [Gemmataceae bacterium]